MNRGLALTHTMRCFSYSNIYGSFLENEKVHKRQWSYNFDLLGKSSKDGNNGINDPGDINPGKAFKICFSNLQE
jgi:hypothetical protein